MYGQTRLGMFGVAVTSILLIIYRVMYYNKLYESTALLPFYNFLHAFSLVFAIFLAFSITVVLARVIKHYIVEIVIFIILSILISMYAVGFTGV